MFAADSASFRDRRGSRPATVTTTELAAVFVFLTSRESSFITVETIAAIGGRLFGRVETCGWVRVRLSREACRVLLIVRHGVTSTNQEGRMLGRADPPLSQLGEQQARQLAEQLPVPDLVISSPLRRALDTAAAFGQPVEVDERWIEMDYGEFDGLHPDSLPDATWQQWRDDPDFAPPGGEPLNALGQRVADACDGLWERAVVSTVLVVTHVSPIKAALAWALEVPIGVSWHMFVEDASVSRIDAKDGEKVVRWFNRGLTRDD